MKKGYPKVVWGVSTLLIMASLVLITSSGDTATTPPKTAPAKPVTAKATPQYGGTLVIRQNMPISMGYPAKSSSNADLECAPICTDTLISFDANGKPQPWLATSWKYSPDLKSLTFSLRKDVKFHDGTDFNAAAVKTNLDLCMAAKRGELASVSSVDVVDAYTVRLNLSKMDAFLIPNLGEFAGIMISPAALAKGEDWCRTNPVGTGPFKQVSYQSGVGVKFEKWSGYWQKGKPYLDAVHIVNIPDDMTAAAAFKKGEVHIINTRDPAIAKGLMGESKASSTPNYLSLVFDSAHKDSPWSDPRVRQAAAYAIDKNTLDKSFGTGLWPISDQFFDKSSNYFSPATTGYPYNLQKAKEVLAASGYPNGFKTKIIYGNASNTQVICTAIQAMLAKIGITLEMTPMNPSVMTQFAIDGWQNGCVTINVGFSPEKEPGRFMQTILSRGALRNSCSTRSPEYDAIMDKLIAEPDFDKRIPLNRQLIKQMLDGDSLIDYCFNNGWVYLKSPKLNDDYKGEIWLMQWLPQDAWFSR
jgi:peptide/nickel transport system substrate-binding protein